VGQAGASVAATNLTNVGTEGYTRKQASLRPEIGGASQNQGGTRVVEPFVERRLLSARSASGEASAEALSLQPLDTIFADNEGSLSTAINSFQASLQEFSSRPSDMAVREQVLARAGQVTAAFKNASAGMKQARSDANQRISGAVDEVNQRLRQIASLGGQINKAESGGGEAGDLRDRRDVLVKEIAERVPVTVIQQDNGASFSLMLAGSQQLVSPDGKVNELSVTDNSGDMRVTKVSAGQPIDVTSMLNTGSIGGLLKSRDGALKQIETKLDQLAFDFQDQYNQVQTSGVALDGSAGPPLFEPLTTVSGAASQIEISADIESQPALLAAGTDPALLPSDNSNALRFTALSVAPIALGGMTVTEALASLTGSAGMAVQTANQAETFASGALDQVTALRDSISGVSSDEEMVSMMKYQRTYEASLQIIQVADQMMQDLLNIRR
jgi:flagellar hook-associated protein 1 FlgK